MTTRVLFVVLILALLASLAACGGGEELTAEERTQHEAELAQIPRTPTPEQRK